MKLHGFYWEHHLQNSDNVVVSVYAGEGAPNDFQRDLYLSVKPRMDELFAAAKKFLIREQAPWEDWDNLSLVTIIIDEEAFNGEIAFGMELMDSTGDFTFDVKFVNYEPSDFEMGYL